MTGQQAALAFFVVFFLFVLAGMFGLLGAFHGLFQ